MKNRRPSKTVRRQRNKAKAKVQDQTLVWPFIVV